VHFRLLRRQRTTGWNAIDPATRRQKFIEWKFLAVLSKERKILRRTRSKAICAAAQRVELE
jgi:hypothetical protein